MKCDEQLCNVSDLVDKWKDNLLRINPEYQRGAQWTTAQQQGLVDSVFRDYPIPPIFLHAIQSKDLKGNVFNQHEVVDGQQRRALADFKSDKYELLDPTNRKLRLPFSLRSMSVPWGRCRYSQLSAQLKQKFCDYKIRAIEITEAQDDEIRDLFIRLQAGTALTRQQIRDAWPGDVGPYIEMLAGKLDRQPSIGLFKLYDKRGSRSDDDKDDYVRDREFCAQLLRLFLQRESDPVHVPPLGANDLDALYHDQTKFVVDGDSSTRFRRLLNYGTQILEKTQELLLTKNRTKKTKFKKLDIFGSLCFVRTFLETAKSSSLERICE